MINKRPLALQTDASMAISLRHPLTAQSSAPLAPCNTLLDAQEQMARQSHSVETN